MNEASDLQSLFESRADRGDFLGAGKVEDGWGLCLSGGGYRAMLYHVGAIQCLNEAGLLGKLTEVASVSGGSITAGALALVWSQLRFDASGRADNLEDLFVTPVTRMAAIGIDIRAGLMGLLPGRTAVDEIAAAYDRYLFAGSSLQDLPDEPRFTFMATNLQTASGWRFAKAYAADYRVGRILAPRFALASVVAASSAFPPFLSPARFGFDGHSVEATEGADLHRPPFTSGAVLTDGGVYDNLGLERVWKRCRTIMVSNAGPTIPEIGTPSGRWIGQTYRTLTIIQQQAENARRRILFGMANAGQRRVAYWSIDTPISAYACSDVLAIADEEIAAAASIRTRLNRFTPHEIELLVKVGHASAGASLQRRGFIASAGSV